MKYLKRIFESIEEQENLEIIENIFSTLIDEGICTVTITDRDWKSNNYVQPSIMIRINTDLKRLLKTSNFSDFPTFNQELQVMRDRINSLANLKNYLSRLEYHGLSWELHLNEGIISIFIKDKKNDNSKLFSCFYNKNRNGETRFDIDEDKIREVFKKKYNVDYSTFEQRPVWQNPSRDFKFLAFDGNILNNKELFNDLDNVIVIVKVEYYPDNEDSTFRIQNKISFGRKGAPNIGWGFYDDSRNKTIIQIKDRLSPKAGRTPKPGFKID